MEHLLSLIKQLSGFFQTLHLSFDRLLVTKENNFHEKRGIGLELSVALAGQLQVTGQDSLVTPIRILSSFKPQKHLDLHTPLVR